MHVKRVFSALKYLILSVAFLFAVVLTGVNLPFIQKLLTEKANTFFIKKNLPVQVEHIALLINGRIGITAPQIIKQTGDTVVYAKKIKVSVRLLPLLFRKVKVNSLTIRDATVNITADTVTGKLDLIALFAPGNKIGKTKKEPGKKWDIQVKTISLKNIRFAYRDAWHGIQINQSVGRFYIRFNRFSLVDRKLYAAFLDLENANGEVTIRQVVQKENVRNHPPAGWEFKLAQSDLREIVFMLHQPDGNKRIEVSLNRGGLLNAGFKLAGHSISMDGLLLREPRVRLYSPSSPAETPRGQKDASMADFPGLWDIAGSNITVRSGSVSTYPYQEVSGKLSEETLFQIAALHTSLKDLRLSSQVSGFTMNRLSFAMGNGFQLNQGKIRLHSDSTGISRLKAYLKTRSSKINLNIEAKDELASIVRSPETVPFSLQLTDVEISAEDVLAFIPRLKERSSPDLQRNFRLGINCRASGTADLLKIENFALLTSSGVDLVASGQISRITTPNANCTATFRIGSINRSGLSELIALTGSAVDLPRFEPITMQGSVSNKLTTPEIMLAMTGLSGNLNLTGAADLPNRRYAVKMKYSDVELGKLFGISDLDRLSGSLDLSGEEFNLKKMKIKASVDIDSAGYRGYNYQNVHIVLEGDQGHYAYALNSSDTSFSCRLAGAVDHSDISTTGEVSGVFNLDAGKLNLMPGMSVSGELKARLDRASGNMNAALSLRDVILTRFSKTEVLEDLTFSFGSSDSLVTGNMQADFLTADFQSANSLADLKRMLSEIRFEGIAFDDSAAIGKMPFFSGLPDMSVSASATYDPFISLLLNDSLVGYDKVMLKLMKDSTDIARAELSVGKFNFGNTGGYGIKLHIESNPGRSDLRVNADSMKYGEIVLSGMAVDVSIEGDSAFYRLHASDKYDRLLYDIAGAAYRSDRQLKLSSTEPAWIINGFQWSVSPGEFLVLEPVNKDFTADLHWRNDQRTLDIYGRKTEKIYIELRNVWLNMLLIPGMNPTGYDGELTGKIDYQSDNKNEVGIRMDIRQMKMADQHLGNMNITGSYLSDTLGTIESDLHAVMNDTTTLDLIVRYGKQEGEKNIRADFSGIPLNFFEPALSKYISGLMGEVSGELALTAIGNKPQLNGSIEIKNTTLKVIPLNARYYLSDDIIRLDNNRLTFNQFLVLDSLKKRLSLNGTIDLNDPGNIIADLQVVSDRLQVMNTTEKDNPAFNGSVFVNTKLAISGPIQKPSIIGNIVLAEGTVINYQYTEDLTVSETEKTITFASLSQDQQAEAAKLASVNPLSRSPNIEASIEINPNSLFNFKISRGFDIGVTITGGGFLNYALMSNNAINLSGTYEIVQGNAELKIPGWPRKDFTITPGSFMKWNGEVDDPELRVETTTRVRGSYYNPVDGKDRQVNFMVYMKLADRLSQLEIVFDVGSNDQYIMSVLNSLSADERMRQAINLLIFERIELPNMASSSNYVTQQINQFWESQLNQFTKSTIKNVDLSIGIDTYTGASEGGGEKEYTSFTYEVKKDLFKERGSVMVSGRMNDNSQAGAPTNNMLENFIFEYALDTNRTKYIKVYRQQNYEDLLEGEVTKSGVGFIYRKSYDRLRDIWRRKKKKTKD